METPTLDPGGFEAFNQMAEETLAVWVRACDVCASYGTALAASRRPEELVAAQARFLADSTDVFASAAGLMLREHGLRAPTLNDS
jgi:hypothetical protein